MASMALSPVSLAGNLAPKATASELLRSLSNGVCGLPVKALGRAQLGAKRRDFITAKLRKATNHEHPWPLDPDPKDKPIDRISQLNMKKRDKPIVPIGKTSESELRDEVEKLKMQILAASKSSAEFPRVAFKETIQKLTREIEYECVEAAKALGTEEKVSMLREEAAKAGSQDAFANPALREKIKQLEDEFKKNLPSAPNYPGLKYKFDMVKDLSKAFHLFKKSTMKDDPKLKISKKLNEVMGQPPIKQKIEALRAEIAISGVSSIDSKPELKEKVSQLRGELESELKAVVRSVRFRAVPSDLRGKVKLRKAGVGKAGNTPGKKFKK